MFKIALIKIVHMNEFLVNHVLSLINYRKFLSLLEKIGGGNLKPFDGIIYDLWRKTIYPSKNFYSRYKIMQSHWWGRDREPPVRK